MQVLKSNVKEIPQKQLHTWNLIYWQKIRLQIQIWEIILVIVLGLWIIHPL
eukprot:UN16920